MRFRIVLAAIVAWLASAQAAPAQLPQQSGAVDLLTQANVQIDGIVEEDELGASLAAAGDVNGDGLADLIAGAEGNDVDERGTSWVIFGRPAPGPVDLAALGSSGMRIVGEAPDNFAGSHVEAAGDVNGDGLDDLLVGAWAAPGGPVDAGSVYVVFGRREGGTVDLSAPGAAVRIDGAAAEDDLSAAARAGDFDGDGTDDIVVAARGADHNGRDQSGSAYVLSGAALSGPAIDLASPGAALLLRIDGAVADDGLGDEDSLAGAGDFNGDDRDDIVIGASGASNNGRQWSGSAYVVFGSDAGGTLDLAALGTRGVQIDGAGAEHFLGATVGAAPDMNADGLADVVLGAPRADHGGASSGSAYVVFGRAAPGTIDLAAPASAALRFDGEAGYWAGAAVGPAGDVNDDGVGDLLIGATDADPHGRMNAGSVFVVYGPVTAPVTRLSALGAGGLRVDGALESSFTGEEIAGLGDFNGDGRDDIAMSGPHTDIDPLAEIGSLTVVYGFGAASLAYPGSIAGRVGEPVAPLEPALRRTGPAAFTVSPPLPAGLALDAATGTIAGTPRAAAAATRHTVTMTDLTGSTTASVDVEIAAAESAPAVAAVSALKVTPRCATSPRRMAVRFHLSAAATVRLRIVRREGGPRAGIRCLRGARFRGDVAHAAQKRFRAVTVRRRLGAGERRLPLRRLLGGRRLRPGPYVVRVSVPGGGVKAAPFRIRART
jgi:Putative Ig domain/FG-GAP-like repeat/FG-GAP repeat